MATITRTSDAVREALRRSVLSAGQGPTAEQQAYAYPRQSELELLGDPQDPTNVTFPFLRLMARDHMVAMGLHFISMPIVRAPWYYEADDARAAAFADNVLRPIYGDLVLTVLRFLRYGYSPASKTFDTVNPAWTYLPGINQAPQRIWDNGNIDAVVYKPVVQLKPENATISWQNGKFNGIRYDNRYGGIGYFIIDGQKKPDIDLDHAVWAVHDKAVEDGSPFGFPRIAHCAPIFHMYRYIWTLLGRAFENNADPGPLVRYPADDGSPTYDADGNLVKNVDVALKIGRRRRSGSTVALPSTPYVDLNERALGVKKWDIEYPSHTINFEAIQNFLGQLEALKLRALWLPEQGMVSGTGEQSNRNVAEEFGNQRDESQSVLMGQIDDFIDEVFIKPAMAMNMPWYEGKLVKKTLGFGQDDEDIVRQALQLIGQADSKGTYATLGIDIRKMMEARGFPMLSHSDQQQLLKEAVAEQAQKSTPPVTPTQGRRALVTQTGFDRRTREVQTDYVQIEDQIVLATDNDFISSLPRTDIFTDAQVVSATRSLRNESKSFLSWAYGDFPRFLGKQKTLDLQDLLDEVAVEHFAETGNELAADDRVRKAVDQVMAKWNPSAQKITAYRDRASSILGRVYDRTVGLQLERISAKARLSSQDKMAANWLQDRGAELVTGILETTRDQMAQTLADGVRAKKSVKDIASDIREQFEGFPDSRASTIARNEIQDAYNYATVAAGFAAGVKKAQLLDGTSDKICKSRNGKVVDLAQALKEKRNHVNCTLCVRLLAGASASFDIRHEQLDGVIARFDPDTQTVLFSSDIDADTEMNYLLALGEKLAVPAQ